MKKINRRNFTTKIGLGILAASAASFIPLKFVKKMDKGSKKIEIKTHPSAVSRKK